MGDSLGWVRFRQSDVPVVSSRQLLPIADQIDRICPEWIIGVFSHWYPLHPRRGMRAEDASQQQPPSAEVRGTNTDRLEVLYSRPFSYPVVLLRRRLSWTSMTNFTLLSSYSYLLYRSSLLGADASCEGLPVSRQWYNSLSQSG